MFTHDTLALCLKPNTRSEGVLNNIWQHNNQPKTQIIIIHNLPTGIPNNPQPPTVNNNVHLFNRTQYTNQLPEEESFDSYFYTTTNNINKKTEIKPQNINNHNTNHENNNQNVPENINFDENIQLYKDKYYKRYQLQANDNKLLWRCPECIPSRSYKTLKCLKNHYKIHSPAAYSCTICNFKSSRPKQLKDHMRVHTGERPFECNICHKKFKHKHTLKAHTLIHLKIKPYTCKICNKKFRVKHNLSKHEITHDPNRKCYSCDYCNKKLKSIEGIRGHLKRYHSGNTPSYTVS